MSGSTLTPRGENKYEPKQEIKEVKQDWQQATDKAKEAASCVGSAASHAVTAVGSAAGQAASDLGNKADNLAESAGTGIREFGDSISRHTPQSGVLGSAGQAVARTVKEGGEYLEHAKFSGMIDDLAQVIKRNPIPAILIAVSVGCLLGRKMRS
jgi:hypothetical protein